MTKMTIVCFHKIFLNPQASLKTLTLPVLTFYFFLPSVRRKVMMSFYSTSPSPQPSAKPPQPSPSSSSLQSLMQVPQLRPPLASSRYFNFDMTLALCSKFSLSPTSSLQNFNFLKHKYDPCTSRISGRLTWQSVCWPHLLLLSLPKPRLW